jgi:mannose/fructose/N-acetylgalactosamine-specific phosphotransferase system component IIB
LIHGQVVEAWLPFLKVDRVVVADDEASGSALIRAAMGLAVEPTVEVRIQKVSDVDYRGISKDGVKTLVLVREVKDARETHDRGLELPRLNLGNVHYASGRKQVSPSVFLSEDEIRALEALVKEGTEVEVRGVPSDRPVAFPEIIERFGRS